MKKTNQPTVSTSTLTRTVRTKQRLRISGLRTRRRMVAVPLRSLVAGANDERWFGKQ